MYIFLCVFLYGCQEIYAPGIYKNKTRDGRGNQHYARIADTQTINKHRSATILKTESKYVLYVVVLSLL